MPRARISVALTLAVSTLAFAFDAGAKEDKRKECIESYERAQELRRSNDHLTARAALTRCIETCPTNLTNDCTAWLSEVDAFLPKVTIRVTGGTPDVVVFVDGKRVEGSLEDVRVEPGVHVARVERGKDGGERSFTVKAGEHATVELTIAPATPASPPAEPPPTTPLPPRAEPDPPSRVPSYVLGGLAVVGLGLGGALAIKGHADRSSLSDSCGTACDPKVVDEVRTTWTVGAISAGVGLAFGVAAVLLWPSRSSSSQSARAFPTPFVIAF